MVAKLLWTLVVFAGALASAELGSISSVEENPSIVQVEVRVGVLWVQQCAGSVLTNRHILSVAKCFSGELYRPDNRLIRAGSSYRGREGTVVGVESAIRHPNYGLLGHDSDVAVVRLDYYLILSNTIQQVAIIGQGIELPPGLEVQLAGWGTTVQGGESSDINLRTVKLTVHNIEDCLTKYFDSHIITENMVCAGLEYHKGRDFDARDLGAPLTYDNTLAALLSFGKQANDEMPVVATSISSYTGWIIESAV